MMGKVRHSFMPSRSGFHGWHHCKKHLRRESVTAWNWGVETDLPDMLGCCSGLPSSCMWHHDVHRPVGYPPFLAENHLKERDMKSQTTFSWSALQVAIWVHGISPSFSSFHFFSDKNSKCNPTKRQILYLCQRATCRVWKLSERVLTIQWGPVSIGKCESPSTHPSLIPYS